MKHSFFSILIILFFSTQSISATITAIADGDWTDNSIWNLGRVPQSGDEIIIPASRSVAIPLFEGVDLTGTELTTLRVLGTLDFALSDITINSGDGDSIIIGPNGSIEPNGAVYFDTRFNDPIFVTSFSGAVTGPAKIENGVLPIELISFQAKSEDNRVELYWSTASEINNDYFTILRSSDGIEYTELDSLPGAGNSSKIINYSFIDQDPLAGRSYYRIKQTDYNGDYEMFDPVSVDFISNNSRNISFNNPVLRGGTVSIVIDSSIEPNSITIVNVNGQVEYSANVLNRSINIEIDEKMKPGLYMIQITGSGFIVSSRLLIQ